MILHYEIQSCWLMFINRVIVYDDYIPENCLAHESIEFVQNDKVAKLWQLAHTIDERIYPCLPLVYVP